MQRVQKMKAAVCEGNVAEVKRMIDEGGHDLRYRIDEACEIGNVEMAILLIGATDEVNIDRALVYACIGGKPNTAQLMINYGATDLSSAAGFAAHFGQFRMVDFMISKGADEPYHHMYSKYTAWLRCVWALPFLCEDVLRMVT